jgi:deoxyribonuclease-4
MKKVKNLGVHCSIAGGVENAILEARKLEIDTFQVFTKNQRQWKNVEIDTSTGEAFKRLMDEYNMQVAFSHAIYLINIATADPALWEKSVSSLIGEVKRCDTLGLPFTVLHPGSNPDEDEGISRVCLALEKVFNETPGSPVKILLENTAGQGNVLGKNFAQLGKIIKNMKDSRLGICFDTCHAFSAGYDIREKPGIEKTFDEMDQETRLENLLAIHFNDSKGELGKRLDRHAHIGQGNLGTFPFQWIIENFPGVPKVLETPKEDDMDRKNLDKLYSLF